MQERTRKGRRRHIAAEFCLLDDKSGSAVNKKAASLAAFSYTRPHKHPNNNIDKREQNRVLGIEKIT